MATWARGLLAQDALAATAGTTRGSKPRTTPSVHRVPGTARRNRFRLGSKPRTTPSVHRVPGTARRNRFRQRRREDRSGRAAYHSVYYFHQRPLVWIDHPQIRNHRCNVVCDLFEHLGGSIVGRYNLDRQIRLFDNWRYFVGQRLHANIRNAVPQLVTHPHTQLCEISESSLTTAHL